MVEHEGKTDCRKIAAARDRLANIKPNAKLTQFFARTVSDPSGIQSASKTSKKVNDILTIPPAILPILPKTANSDSAVEHGNPPETQPRCKNDTPHPPPHETTLKTPLLIELETLALALPDSIPEATSSDKIFVLGGVIANHFASEVCTASHDEDWEHINPLMHNVFGYGGQESNLITLIRRGESGVLGMCKFLNHFISKHGLSIQLMEGKLTVLKSAMMSL